MDWKQNEDFVDLKPEEVLKHCTNIVCLFAKKNRQFLKS